MKPLFLLKYCFIKDLKKNLATGCTDFTAGRRLRCSVVKEHIWRRHDESCTPNEDRKTASLYNGAKLRVWSKKVHHEAHEEHEEKS